MLVFAALAHRERTQFWRKVDKILRENPRLTIRAVTGIRGMGKGRELFRLRGSKARMKLKITLIVKFFR